MPQTLRDTHPRAHNLITEIATHSREAAFPREADEDRCHALVEITYANPYSIRCSETVVVEAL